MKKFLFTLSILVCSLYCQLSVSAQTSRPYPIPSFNVLVDPSAVFQETTNSNSKGKRNIKIHVSSPQKNDTTSCFANVMVYSLDLQDALGPFHIDCGETLSVPIDEREWGVYVISDTPVIVSVWIAEDALLKQPAMPGDKTGNTEGCLSE